MFKSKSTDSRKLKETFAVALTNYADSNDVSDYVNDKDEEKELNQLGITKVVEARIREILKLAKNEIKNLTNREIRYIIITGGLTEMSAFSYLVEQEFGFVAKVCNLKALGVRHNMYSSCFGITKYFDDKLALRGKNYHMVSEEDVDALVSADTNTVVNESIISKVFGHFFDS